jgi:hypothetical protein
MEEDLHILTKYDKEYQQRSKYTVPMNILCDKNTRKEILVMTDTGALMGSYIREEVARKLMSECSTTCKCIETPGIKICSGFKGDECRDALGAININLTYKNEVTGEQDEIEVLAKIINIKYDVIIGRPEIYKHRLAASLPSQFFGPKQEESALKAEDVHILDSLDSTTRLPLSKSDSDTAVPPTAMVWSIKTKEELFDTKAKGDDGIPRNEVDPPWSFTSALGQQPEDETDVIDMIEIHGSPVFQAKIRAVCEKYRNVFSMQLSNKTADLPLMPLHVDGDKWRNLRSNKMPHRPLSAVKQEAVRQIIEKMLASEVIQPSQAEAWSQIHMTEKKGGGNSWRLNVDLRDLNSCTGSDGTGWPLPKIDEMLRRVGEKKPKYFGVIDLTSGYWQAGLEPASWKYTAFRTFMGLFEFTRIPMGAKKAPSFFQWLIAGIVLAGLIYIICESYLDDVLLHGQNEDDFCENLGKVLEAFDRKNVKANPQKTKLGLEQIEVVGHVVNSEGMTFTREKIDSVLEFPKPINGKHMKSFLGLCNVFRNHIKEHSKKVACLNEMIHNYEYTRTRKLVWTDETNQAFEDIKLAIHELPTLFFTDPSLPIKVETDASNYGIGAYAYQPGNDGVNRPIAFISKSLNAEQFRWSTIEKEAYAIYYALVKWEYLLRDTKFTIYTDHKNLTYMGESTNPKVQRWKLTVQDFDFTNEYLKGANNTVGDPFSRLCTIDPEALAIFTEENPTLNEEELYNLLEEDIHHISKENYKKISAVHNTSEGHFGAELTYEKLKKGGNKKDPQTWDTMRQDIKRFIQMCPCCQMMKQIKTCIHTQPFTLATARPMQRLNVDTFGPLPADAEGYAHVLQVIDTCTRWVEYYPLKSTDAEETSLALLDYMGRYGEPEELTSDKGSQFVNGMIDQLLIKLVQVGKNVTLAYSKEENAIVERANKEAQRHLKAILFDTNVRDDWRRMLPFVQRIVNTKKHISTGVSPIELLMPALSVEKRIILEPTYAPGTEQERAEYNGMSLGDWTDKILYRQMIAMKVAEATQNAKDIKHMDKHELKDTPFNDFTEFPIDSYVTANYPMTRMGALPPTKLHAPQRGPFRVVEREGTKYILMNLITNKYEPPIHVKQLTKFEFDPEHTDPTLIALRQQNVYIVEEIRGKKGNFKRRSELMFKVHWKGFNDEDDTWEPWKTLRTNEVLHAWMRTNGFEKDIPTQYQPEQLNAHEEYIMILEERNRKRCRFF